MKNKDVCSEEDCDKIAKIGLGGNGFNNLYCGKHFEIIMKHQETREQNFYDKGYAQAKIDFDKMIDECSEHKGSWYKYYVKVKELKAKLKEGDKT